VVHVTSPRPRRACSLVALSRLVELMYPRRDELRTNLWLVPTLEMLAAVALFVGTGFVDRIIYRDHVQLPS